MGSVENAALNLSLKEKEAAFVFVVDVEAVVQVSS